MSLYSVLTTWFLVMSLGLATSMASMNLDSRESLYDNLERRQFYCLKTDRQRDVYRVNRLILESEVFSWPRVFLKNVAYVS